MKFTRRPDIKDYLACELCGGMRFIAVPGRRVRDRKKLKDFLFFRCAKCTGMGYWTHKRLINRRHKVSTAVQKEVSRPDQPLDLRI